MQSVLVSWSLKLLKIESSSYVLCLVVTLASFNCYFVLRPNIRNTHKAADAEYIGQIGHWGNSYG